MALPKAVRLAVESSGNSRLHVLHGELRECQQRLGTAAEMPTDFEHVLVLAHAINNELTTLYFAADTADE